MNRRIPYDQGLILVVLALMGFGLVMVFSASPLVSREIYGSQSHIFTRQLIAMVLGFLLFLLAMRLNYRIYEKPAFIYPALIMTAALLVLPLLFAETNGARRWIGLGPVSFQPAELAKPVVVCFTAFYLSHWRGTVNSFSRGVLPYGCVLGGLLLLILVEPDLGTAGCIAMTAGFLLFLGGLNYRYFMALALLSIPSFYFLVLQVPYRRDRILSFLDPTQDPFGAGYQIRQSLIAIGSGGLNGLGFAEGTQKLFFLPEPHTDFIYAVVGEELGLAGCLAVLLLFVLFFWRGVRISLRADSPFGVFLGLGIVCMIVLQALVNMSVATSLVPTKGIPLPFISVGGSSMLVMMLSVGILLNISRNSRNGESPRISS